MSAVQRAAKYMSCGGTECIRCLRMLARKVIVVVDFVVL